MFPELELREGWATVVFLLIMFLAVAWSIQSAAWTEGLAILQGVVLVGGAVGIVLAKSRVPNRMSHLLSILAGLTWGAYLTSRVLVATTGLPVQVAVVELEMRLQSFLFIPFQGGSADNYVFLLLLALLLWVMAYLGAWAVFRWQRAWWAVILCGLAMMLNITYAPANLTVYLVIFLLFALLLVVRASVALYEQEWRMAHVGYSPELVSGFLQAGLALSIVLILLAWIAPAALASRPLQPVWDKVGAPWRRFQDRVSDIFQDLNYQNEPAFISFDRWTKFGGPIALTDRPVMDVQATTGRYWRVMVFHEYTGEGWINTDPDTILIEENKQTLAVPPFRLRQQVTQTITLRQDLGPAGMIAAAGQPLRAALPLRAVVKLVPTEPDPNQPADASPRLAAPSDPSVLYSRLALKAGESYQVLSSLTLADEESLRRATTDYPTWVAPRYLQVPDSLPDRVRLLADRLTADRETPYDKAKALERYLRNIPYNERIEGPAPGQDGVDYFLFDVGEGYCDYYASAMVVMLRAVGVPARYVRGYSQTQREEGVYHILEQDGHAWPEVFFPDYGWVEFEPTGGEPVLVRPRSQDEGPEGRADDRDRRAGQRDLDEMIDTEINPDLLEPDPTPMPQPIPLLIAVGGGGGGLAVGIAIITLFLLRRRRTESLSAAEWAYENLVNWARRLLRVRPLTHQTPHEYADAVARTVPRGRQAVERIADLYVEERFGARTVPDATAEVAWRQARPALWRRWVERQVEGLRRRVRIPGLPR